MTRPISLTWKSGKWELPDLEYVRVIGYDVESKCNVIPCRIDPDPKSPCLLVEVSAKEAFKVAGMAVYLNLPHEIPTNDRDLRLDQRNHIYVQLISDSGKPLAFQDEHTFNEWFSWIDTDFLIPINKDEFCIDKSSEV